MSRSTPNPSSLPRGACGSPIPSGRELSRFILSFAVASSVFVAVSEAAPGGGISYDAPAMSTPLELLSADFGRRGLRMPDQMLTERYKLACDGGWLLACEAPTWHTGPVADLERAAPLLEKACDQGDGASCIAFGWALEARARSKGDPEQFKAAARRYKAQCDEAKNQYGCYEYGALLFNATLGATVDPRLGTRRWEAACEGGEKAACTALARVMRVGAPNIKADLEKASAYARRSCDMGDTYGCLEFDVIRGAEPSELMGRRLAICRAGGVSACWELSTGFVSGEPEPSTGMARGVLELGCELGSGPSCANAAAMVARDGEKDLAGELYRQACALSEPAGCAGIVEMVLASNVEGGLRDHRQAFEVACERGGNAAACSALGLALLDGASFRRDPTRARALLVRSCVDSASPAQPCFVLGDLFETGAGGDKDRTLASQYYRWACTQGHGEACERRGDLLHVGVGVKLDDPESVANYQLGCDAGRPTACHKAAVILDEGAIVARDPARARDLYAIACEKSVPDACLRLGLLFEEGAAGGKQEKDARDAFEKAVALGNVEAHRRLAHLLWNGIGGKKEKGRAKKLCAAGCKADDPIACRGPEWQRSGL